MNFGRIGEESFFSYSKKERSGTTKSEISKVVIMYYFEMVMQNKWPVAKIVQMLTDDNGDWKCKKCLFESWSK